MKYYEYSKYGGINNWTSVKKRKIYRRRKIFIKSQRGENIQIIMRQANEWSNQKNSFWK